MKRILYSLLCLALFGVVSCNSTSEPGSSTTTSFGTSTPMGDGTARSWITVDQNNVPQSLGVSLSHMALTNLPDTGMFGTSYMLDLPSQKSLTPFDHISFDWGPRGHDPMPTYGVGHFDAHFYTITPQQRGMITPFDSVSMYRMPDSAKRPAGYIGLPGAGVPGMGWHWADPLSPEHHGSTFSHTFIYGFFNGEVAFLEPMFTKALLESKTSVEGTIAQPQAFSATGKYYPTKYRIYFDNATSSHMISLEGFVKR